MATEAQGMPRKKIIANARKPNCRSGKSSSLNLLTDKIATVYTEEHALSTLFFRGFRGYPDNQPVLVPLEWHPAWSSGSTAAV
jgi:hypothetical protein